MFKRISSKLSRPQQIALARESVIRLRRTWKARTGKGLAARRYQRRLLRRLQMVWRQRFPEAAFPQFVSQKVEAAEVWIVIPAPSERDLPTTPGMAMLRRPVATPPPDRRKSLRANIWQALGDAAALTVGNSGIRVVPNERAGGPVLATPAGRRPRVTMESLDAVGVVLMSGLDQRLCTQLAGAGATVLPNLEIDAFPSHPVGSGTHAAGHECGKSISVKEVSRWHLDKINHDASKQKDLSGQNVRIGFIDTGINVVHPEFSGRSVQYMHVGPTKNDPGVLPRDDDGHGTHVAALAAGNSTGVATQAELYMAAVFVEKNANGVPKTSLTQIFRGLNWLLSREVDIINMSLTLGNYPEGSIDDSQKKLIEETILQVADDQGILTIAASGNDGGHVAGLVGSPAILHAVKAVGATDINDDAGYFSAWNDASKPDLYAQVYVSIARPVPE